MFMPVKFSQEILAPFSHHLLGKVLWRVFTLRVPHGVAPMRVAMHHRHQEIAAKSVLLLLMVAGHLVGASLVVHGHHQLCLDRAPMIAHGHLDPMQGAGQV